MYPCSTDPGVAFDEARARSSEVLEDVLQSQLGLFFLCSLFLSTYALGALVTKVCGGVWFGHSKVTSFQAS